MKKDLIFKIIIVLLIIIIFFVAYNLFNKKEEVIKFELIGKNHEIIKLGDNYQELGFIATNNYDEDLTKYVEIENKVDTNQIGTYIVRYTLNKDNYNKELKRLISVVESLDNDYYLLLNGKKEIYHLLGKEYIDEGSLFYDENGNVIDVNINYTCNVNTNKEGIYTAKYSVFYENKTYEVVRDIYVYDLGVEYIKINRNNGVDIIFNVNQNYFDYVELPDKTISKEYSFTYHITDNGKYEFIIHDIYGNLISEVVTIDSFSNDLSCSGVVNRNGTNLTINGQDRDKFYSYEWNIDGIKVNGSTVYNLSFKKVSSAYVIAKNDTQSIKLDCQITNKLAYDFKFDRYNTKPFISCNTYNLSDRVVLESKLKRAVSDAGYGTRAGVVEAARFLVGGLDYKIPYLGPKTVNFNLGRYPNVGLNIGHNEGWGCSVSGWTQGMDCTNFVEWAFVQAGLRSGNVYSQSNIYNLTEVINRLKVGDLLLTPKDDSFSHVGIIIGIDNSNIYVAESTTGNINAIVVTTLSKSNLPRSGSLSKAKLYSYPGDGVLTNMWVS